ncbi:MAG: tyrosine-type recombinase/integrase [Planctomycetes bacterium]|nr:tyrosine-type recombinase/integrase [Planctomycetota bacterium]
MTKTMYLAPFVRSYFEDHLVCRQNASRHTIQGYRDGMKLLLRFASEQTKKSAVNLLVTDITELLVLTFLVDLEQTRGNSIQTRNHRLAGIRKLFEYIAAREPLLLDHCHQIVAIPKKRGAALPAIRYLEKDQLGAILGGVPRETSSGRRDYAMLLFMYNTGARVQEVADTCGSWLTLTPPFKVELLGKGRKWRTCPLWESTVQHLRQLVEERGLKPGADGYLFVNQHGQPLSRSGIANLIARYTVKAAATMPGLQSLKVTPHTFRHTTAMHLLQSGVEVNVIRSWLGHASITTTNRYIEIDLAMKRKALETCEVGASGPATQPTWRSDVDILAWLESL